MNAVYGGRASESTLGEHVKWAGRLMCPSAKIINRLMRQAVAHVAAAERSSYDRVETSVQRARLHISHKLAHDHYPDPIKDLMEELIQASEQFLGIKDFEKHFPQLSIEKLQKSFNAVVEAWKKTESGVSLSADDVRLFLVVFETMRTMAEGEGYNPALLDKNEYLVLATLMANNFGAYAKTLA